MAQCSSPRCYPRNLSPRPLRRLLPKKCTASSLFWSALTRHSRMWSLRLTVAIQSMRMVMTSLAHTYPLTFPCLKACVYAPPTIMISQTTLAQTHQGITSTYSMKYCCYSSNLSPQPRIHVRLRTDVRPIHLCASHLGIKPRQALENEGVIRIPFGTEYLLEPLFAHFSPVVAVHST